jgi:hypothetical protein
VADGRGGGAAVFAKANHESMESANEWPGSRGCK